MKKINEQKQIVEKKPARSHGGSGAGGGKVLSGVVVSDKMKDTVVVLVERYEKHPKYDKFVKHKKKFKAHDAGNTKKIGDKVSIRETKPMSKDKHFIIID